MNIHHLRIIIGIFFLFAAYNERSWLLGIVAAIVFIQGLLKRPCTSGGCTIDNKMDTQEKAEYEK